MADVAIIFVVFILCRYNLALASSSVERGFSGEDSQYVDDNESIYLPDISFPSDCNDLDSCQHLPSAPTGVQSCYCDNMCELYQDCCSDYNITNGSVSSTSIVKFDCVNVSSLETVQRFIKSVSSCPLSYAEAMNEMITRCNSSREQLPPATDLSTNITYKNIYCARCNGIITTEEWTCDFSAGNECTFVEPPFSLVRECYSDEIVESCPSYKVSSTYYSASVPLGQYSLWVKRCKSYQKLVKCEDVIYRNEYCAL